MSSVVQSASVSPPSLLPGGIGRAGRYVTVTLINIVNHQLILQLAVYLWGWSGGWANAFAATIAAVPAYLMSRYWVWQVRGRNSLRGEILPFWGIALVGLVVSSAAAEAADRMFSHPLMISVGSLFGYFVVWVVKFLLLNRLFAGGRAASSADETVTVGG